MDGPTDRPTDGRTDGGTDGRTDGPTDGRTDGRTDRPSYRDAWTDLKTDYQRKPIPEIIHCSKQQTKALIISIFGILECGRNYMGTQSDICGLCNVTDD